MSDYPDPNELVVCRIKGIKNYGVFVDLQEYNKEGFVHISNVASGWIKNIRSHVSEGQIRVGQVVRVDKGKNLIDISFRKVSTNQEKRKMSEYKRAKRANKLFERAAQQLKEDPAVSFKKIAVPLKDEFGDLFSAFEAMSAHGADAINGIKMPKKWAELLVSLAEENISPPKVNITGTLKIRAYTPDGINSIKALLKKLEKPNLHISYVSAPNYKVSVTAADYPDAEKALKKAIQLAEKEFKKIGDISFERSQK